MNDFNGYFKALLDPQLAATAFRVALVVGSILLMINHGKAIIEGKMTKNRWVSGLLTYLVPYSVNIHGQYINRSRH